MVSGKGSWSNYGVPQSYSEFKKKNPLPRYNSPAPYKDNYNWQPNVGNVGNWQVPKIQLPDYSKFGNYQDLTGRIGEYANKATEAGLKQLQELTFKPEYQAERERIASRGLVGSGVENEALKNLMTSQQARARELATNIQNKAFEQQTAELQHLRELQADKEKMQMQQQFEAAIKAGDWAQAKKLHDDEVSLDLARIQGENARFRAAHALDVAKFNNDSHYREFMARLNAEDNAIAKYQAETGVQQKERQLDIQEATAAANRCAQAGYEGSDFDQCVNDALGGRDELRASGGGAHVYKGIGQKKKIRTVDTLSNGTYGLGDIVFVKKNHKYYQKVDNTGNDAVDFAVLNYNQAYNNY